jgi:hypothetical protein
MLHGRHGITSQENEMTRRDIVDTKGNGIPIEATTKPGGAKSVRHRSSQTLFGMPLIDIAYGPDPARGEKRGHAQGIIALGDRAQGVIALGGRASGLLAMGGSARGIIALGGRSAGLIAMGGMSAGLVAMGGLAVGAIAVGGLSLGLMAAGGRSAGLFSVSIKDR